MTPRNRTRLLASLRDDRLRQLADELRTDEGMLSSPVFLMPQLKMQVLSHLLFYTSGIGGGIVEKMTDIIIGNGFGFESKHPEVQAAIEEFWKDPIHSFIDNEDLHAAFLAVYGELCFTHAIKPSSKRLRLGFVEGWQIERTITCPENRRYVIGVKLRTSDEQILTTALPPGYTERDLFGPSTRKLRSSFSTRSGKVYCSYFAVNPRMIDDGGELWGPQWRGTPDLFPLIDTIGDAEEILKSAVERADLASRIVWDVNMPGASQDEVNDFVANTPLPDKYTINGHNDKAQWSILSPDLKASEHDTQYKMVRNAGISGKGAGLPPTYFGDGGDVNLASAKELPFATIKRMTRRQSKIGGIFKTLIEQQLSLKGLPADDVQAVMPTISEKDMELFSKILESYSRSLIVGEERRWLSPQEARRVYRGNLEDMGYELDEDAPQMSEAESGQSSPERVTEDYADSQEY